MNILKAVFSIGLILGAAPASAADGAATAREYIAAMCTLNGNWTGQFEQYNESGLFRTSRLDAGFQCQPGDDVLMETNIFFQDDGTSFPTLKVIFPAEQETRMQMSYFYGGVEKTYFFKAASLEFEDDEHWQSARESTKRIHESDKKPPVSRYTHIRSGGELTMIREVKPDHGSNDWSLSAKLVLQLQP